MAELPDLTVFSNILTRKFNGKILDFLEVTESRKLNVSEAVIKRALEGDKLTNVIREGKTLQLHFSGNQVLGIHLMLRGELVDLKDGNVPKLEILMKVTTPFRFKSIAMELEVHLRELLYFEFDMPKYSPLRKDRKK